MLLFSRWLMINTFLITFFSFLFSILEQNNCRQLSLRIKTDLSKEKYYEKKNYSKIAYPYLVLFPHIFWFLPVPFPMSYTLFRTLAIYYWRPSWKSPIQHGTPVICKMSLADCSYLCKLDRQWKNTSRTHDFWRIAVCSLYIFIFIFVKVCPWISITFILPQIWRFVQVMLQFTFFLQNTGIIQKINTQCRFSQPVEISI